MDYSGQRPPRARRPSYSQYSQQPLSPSSPSSYVDQPPSPYSPYSRSSSSPHLHDGNNVSFQTTERGDRRAPLDQPGRVRQHSAYQNILPPSPDPESGFTMTDAALVGRKKSLVRPDREKIEPGHRHWHYRTHAARLEDTDANLVHPSSTFSISLLIYLY
jgi:chitin synthase